MYKSRIIRAIYDNLFSRTYRESRRIQKCRRSAAPRRARTRFGSRCNSKTSFSAWRSSRTVQVHRCHCPAECWDTKPWERERDLYIARPSFRALPSPSALSPFLRAPVQAPRYYDPQWHRIYVNTRESREHWDVHQYSQPAATRANFSPARFLPSAR